MALILWQYTLIPYAFHADRLFIFSPKSWDRNGGDPTGIYLGMSFGCTFVIISHYFSRNKGFLASVLGYFFIALIMFILLAYSSRAAILAAYTAALFIFICQIFVDRKISSFKWLLILITSFFIILNTTYERSNFLLQISNNLKTLQFKDTFKEIFKNKPQEMQSIPPEIQADKFKLDPKYKSKLPMLECIKNGDSVGTRLLFYREAMRFFYASPVLGVGPGGYGRLYCEGLDPSASPHFLFLQVLVEFGLIGGLLLVLNFLFLPVFMLYQKNSLKSILQNSNIRLIIALWIFFMLYEQFSGNIYYAYHYFLISGILVARVYDYNEYSK